MLSLILLASASVATVEHRGARFQVAHTPVVQHRVKTVGNDFGPRASTQQCRWTASIGVERAIGGAGGVDAGQGVRTLLPLHREISGVRPGACRSDEHAALIADARVERAAAALVAQAGADRAGVLASIDAINAVAAR